MDFYQETKTYSLIYTMLLKYSLKQTTHNEIKKLYRLLNPAQNRRKLKSDYFKILYRIFISAIIRHYQLPFFRQY